MTSTPTTSSFTPRLTPYPAEAATWRNSGWQSDAREEPRVHHENTEAKPDLSTRIRALVPDQVTTWWGTMSELQLRGFIILVSVLTILSAGSVAVNYWMGGFSETRAPNALADTSSQGSGAQPGGLTALPPASPSPTQHTSTVLVAVDQLGRILPIQPGSGTMAPLGSPGPVIQPGGGGSSAAAGLVNLNSADRATLETLPGVGPATAQAIIDYRTHNGPFTSVDELAAVDGIGPGKLAKIRGHATV